jgi:biopolymer transport protein ExbB
MTLYEVMDSSIGNLAIPFLICSIITVTLLLERLIVLVGHTLHWKKITKDSPLYADQRKPPLIVDGLRLIDAHRQQQKAVREEIASLWISDQKLRLSSGIRVLQVVGLLAPLLGLLGTVLGLIEVFSEVSHHSGPIEPSMLADGLGLALYTTAVGLVIALPALAAAYSFQIWVDRLIAMIEKAMNRASLKIDGLEMEAWA